MLILYRISIKHRYVNTPYGLYLRYVNYINCNFPTL